MMKNEIGKYVFEDNQVEIIEVEGQPMFEVYSTGMALGQTFEKILRNGESKLYPRKERINENLKNAEIVPLVRCGLNLISEPQLYDLMLEMKTDKVKPFRKWFTTEVLPTIRKTGGYVSNDDLFINTYIPFADDSTKMLFKSTLQVVSNLNKIIEEQAPKIELADHLFMSTDTLDMLETSKLLSKNGINIGRTKLLKFLRTKGILMADNLPYQKYIDWFDVIEQVFDTGYDTKIRLKVLVTPKGQAGIFKLLKKDIN